MTGTEKPQVQIDSSDAPPTELVVEDLVEGTGEEAAAGHDVEVHYVGVAWSSNTQFDASWDRRKAFKFPLGGGRVIAGWDQGVAGMKVGGRRKITIPPHLGYGDAGAGGVIKGGETLVFVVDLQGVG
jgi:peptidylprolyl isomerase